MSCFHPNAVIYNYGELGRFAGPCTDKLLSAYSDIEGAEVVPVSCGKCIGCRLDRSRAWADRMLLEFATPRDGISKRALFVTLTYDDEHVPGIVCTDNQYRYNLNLPDFQKFLKRLRKAFPDKLVRYYLAGEYGETTFRPHGHLILYNFSLDDFPDTFLYSTDSESGDPLYESPYFNSIWTNGAVRFCPATYQTFCYVGRYILKKQFISDAGSLFYKGRNPPFSTMSRKPALGSDYFSVFDPDSKVFINDGVEVHDISLPRINLEKLELTNPELYDSIKTTRKAVANSKHDLLISETDLSFQEMNKKNEVIFREKMKRLGKREL